MFWILLGLAVVVVAALVFLFMTSSPPKVKTREDFLADIVKYTDGLQSEIPDAPNSFRIDFDFEGHRFWYEDIESVGFTQKVYKGILKIKTSTNLNLIFVRKDRNKLLGGDVQMMSKLSDVSVNKQIKVFVPSELKEFDVFTPDVYKINLFLEDKKIRSTLSSLKQVDRQGEPFMPVSISDGAIFLELSSDERMKLNRQILIDNVPMMEKLADSMIVLLKAADKTNPAV